MRWAIFVAVLLVQQEYQPPAHGPYYGKEGYGCWRYENGDLHAGKDKATGKEKLVHMIQCACKAPCDNEGNRIGEDKACQTYCQQNAVHPQCVCHADECPSMEMR